MTNSLDSETTRASGFTRRQFCRSRVASTPQNWVGAVLYFFRALRFLSRLFLFFMRRFALSELERIFMRFALSDS